MTFWSVLNSSYYIQIITKLTQTRKQQKFKPKILAHIKVINLKYHYFASETENYFLVTKYINTQPPTIIKGNPKLDNVEPDVFIILLAIPALTSTTLFKSLLAPLTRL